MRLDRLKIFRSGQSARRGITRAGPVSLMLVCLGLPGLVNAQTPIHKCVDADGGVAYSQLPCPPQEPSESENTEPESEAESATQVSEQQVPSTNEVPKEKPESEASRSACKKRYRDAIDAIDAEIGREYSTDKAEEYKRRLLRLTRKLRQC